MRGISTYFLVSRMPTGSVIICMDMDSSIKKIKLKPNFYCFVTSELHVIYGAVLWMAHLDADSDPDPNFDVDDLDWNQKDAVPHAYPTQVSHMLENLNF